MKSETILFVKSIAISVSKIASKRKHVLNVILKYNYYAK